MDTGLPSVTHSRLAYTPGQMALTVMNSFARVAARLLERCCLWRGECLRETSFSLVLLSHCWDEAIHNPDQLTMAAALEVL